MSVLRGSLIYSKAWSFRNRGVEAPALISKIEGEIELPTALNFLDFTPENAKFSRACGAPALISKSAGGIQLKSARRISMSRAISKATCLTVPCWKVRLLPPPQSRPH